MTIKLLKEKYLCLEHYPKTLDPWSYGNGRRFMDYRKKDRGFCLYPRPKGFLRVRNRLRCNRRFLYVRLWVHHRKKWPWPDVWESLRKKSSEDSKKIEFVLAVFFYFSCCRSGVKNSVSPNKSFLFSFSYCKGIFKKIRAFSWGVKVGFQGITFIKKYRYRTE